MRGAVRNLATDSYDIIEGSLMDGLNKKNMAAHSNTILEGAYPKTIDSPAVDIMLSIGDFVKKIHFMQR